MKEKKREGEGKLGRKARKEVMAEIRNGIWRNLRRTGKHFMDKTDEETGNKIDGIEEETGKDWAETL